MAAPSSKLDYLKKYMSDVKDPVEKRKKRKKPFNPKANSGIIVVDSEIEVHKLKKCAAVEDDPYRDNGPTVAEIFDESIPRGMQDSKKWKSIVSRDTNGDGGGRGAVTVRRESPDSDQSPPRLPPPSSSSSGRKRAGTSRSQESRRDGARSEDSDLSPDRGPVAGTSRRRSPAEDVSVRRQSSARKSGRASSGDLSPVRSGKNSRPPRAGSPDSDLSPVRVASSSRREASPRETKPSGLLTKTLSGMTAGLQSAKTLRTEADQRRRREEETFEKMDTEISGRNAETVYRDRKTGKRRDMDAEAVIEAEKAARKKVHDDKFKKWGKGLVQGEKREQNVTDALHEMSKPLARYVDDSDRDALLKAVDRDGDPMLDYLKTKKTKAAGEAGRPRYKGAPPAPNRFAIYSGYRWDGVDRSNGFEKGRFDRISNRSAVSEQAYKWSTEDM